MEVDPAQITVPGSRWPIIFSKPRPMGATALLTPAAPMKVVPPILSSTVRRKPKMTYRSPDADSPLRIEGPRKTLLTVSSVPSVVAPGDTRPTTPSSTSSVPSRCQSPIFKPSPPIFQMRPPLPVYHPLGPRPTTSLPDAPNVYSLKLKAHDNGPLGDENDARRSSSRTRKPAAKLREAEDREGEDDTFAVPAPVAGGAAARSVPSPKKRRANGTGGAARKKRKDAGPVDRDGTYPNRKTRRGQAQHSGNDGMDIDAASPTESNVPGSPEEKEPDVEVTSNAKKPATRTRRPRLAASASLRRRGSSASEATATSVSVSIAGTLAAGKGAVLETPGE